MHVPEFILDNREHLLAELLPEVPISQLDLGDFQILVDGQPVYILERKTIEDLVASVKDARYKEQKERTMAFCTTNNSCKFAYVLEGSMKYGDDNPKQKMVTGCLVNSMVRDGIPFYRTRDLAETAQLLKSIMSRVTKDADKYFTGRNKSDEGTGVYVDALVKQKKKDNVNQHTVVLLQLTAIPGISTKKATEIINVHNITSISDLCDKMKVAKPKDFFKTVHGIGKILQSSIYVFCGVDPGSS